MDFEPVPDLEVEGYRLAPITMIEPDHEPSGDAWLLCPDGTHVDLYWRAEESENKAVWNASEVDGGRGVIWVTVTGAVTAEADLEAVLRLTVGVACQVAYSLSMWRGISGMRSPERRVMLPSCPGNPAIALPLLELPAPFTSSELR